ncbi:MAG: D-amino acid dehydrogenase [Bauldia sp.]|nr:D-amino acid dehydrogenase [Bauldia sp.]
MKVAVLGSGVIGVTTAYYLVRAGHEVTVVDRQPGPALETSFANAGEISPGYSSPWAAPGLPGKALHWLLMANGPLVIRPRADPAMWRFVTGLLGNCTAERYAANKARMVRLAEYSRDCLREVRSQHDIVYDQRMLGTLQLFRTEEQVKAAAKDIAVLADSGVAYEELDTDGCLVREPGLRAARGRIAGGLLLPGDETGDCAMFTTALAAIAEGEGVRFRYGVTVRRIVVSGDTVTGVETDAGFLAADTFVVALGSYSPLLLRPIGLPVPVYPVKGYSLTVPILDESRAPTSTIVDETYKMAVTRLGARIRVGGTAELSGFDLTLRPKRRETLAFLVNDLYAGAGDLEAATFWCGLRPTTPDGPPILGATRYRNLHLNTGHGTLGWTMACGSGRVVADLVSGRTPEIAVDDLRLGRPPLSAPI